MDSPPHILTAVLWALEGALLRGVWKLDGKILTLQPRDAMCLLTCTNLSWKPDARPVP